MSEKTRISVEVLDCDRTYFLEHWSLFNILTHCVRGQFLRSRVKQAKKQLKTNSGKSSDFHFDFNPAVKSIMPKAKLDDPRIVWVPVVTAVQDKIDTFVLEGLRNISKISRTSPIYPEFEWLINYFYSPNPYKLIFSYKVANQRRGLKAFKIICNCPQMQIACSTFCIFWVLTSEEIYRQGLPTQGSVEQQKNWTAKMALKILTHIALMPLRKLWIQQIPHQLWVNSRAD